MTETTATARLKPIGFLGSLLYFGIPCAVFSASILGLLPWMIRHGYGVLLTFMVTFGSPLLLMLIAALVFYRLEGRPWTWAAFRDRMRLQKPTARDWLWTGALIIVTLFGGLVIAPVAQLFSGVHFYNSPPEFITVMTGLQDGTFGGMAMHGRWDILAMMAVCLIVLNIGGEELWWRGIILPRQELAFGKWAWLVNGLLWDLFHFFYHTDGANVVAYLAATVPLAFVAQKTRNTWPGIITHLISNRAALVMVFLAVTK